MLRRRHSFATSGTPTQSALKAHYRERGGTPSLFPASFVSYGLGPNASTAPFWHVTGNRHVKRKRFRLLARAHDGRDSRDGGGRSSDCVATDSDLFYTHSQFHQSPTILVFQSLLSTLSSLSSPLSSSLSSSRSSLPLLRTPALGACAWHHTRPPYSAAERFPPSFVSIFLSSVASASSSTRQRRIYEVRATIEPDTPSTSHGGAEEEGRTCRQKLLSRATRRWRCSSEVTARSSRSRTAGSQRFTQTLMAQLLPPSAATSRPTRLRAARGFWDFVSLPQKGPNGEARSDKDAAMFKSVLDEGIMGNFYGLRQRHRHLRHSAVRGRWRPRLVHL